MKLINTYPAPDLDHCDGWIVLGRAPRKKEMEWPEWEPMGEANWKGHTCLMRRSFCTVYATEDEAAQAVKRIKTVADMFGLNWHKGTEFRLVPLLHTSADVPEQELIQHDETHIHHSSV